jgi:hypothetical protein
MDFALSLESSSFVHLLLAYGAEPIDIRRAYSAVDRPFSPQPFRLMETYGFPPFSQFLLAREDIDSTKIRAYLNDFLVLSKHEINKSIEKVSGHFLRLGHADHLIEIKCLYERSWSFAMHSYFPRSYRAVVVVCVFSKWTSASDKHSLKILPLVLWETILSFCDRGAFEIQTGRQNRSTSAKSCR